MAVGLGGAGGGSVAVAGRASVMVAGTAATWPTLTCTCSAAGGAAVYALINLTSGDEIHVDGLLVLPGETVVIDCETVTVRSNYRGDLSATVRAGSRPLRLLPGVANALLFTGDAAMTATLGAVARFASLQAAEES